MSHVTRTHAGLHLANEHSRLQELERGKRYHPVSPPHHLFPHSSDSWRHFFSSDNGVNSTNYCVVVLKCFSTQHHVNPGELNWTELNWTPLSRSKGQGHQAALLTMALTRDAPIIGISRLLHRYQPIIVYTLGKYKFLGSTPERWA